MRSDMKNAFLAGVTLYRVLLAVALKFCFSFVLFLVGSGCSHHRQVIEEYYDCGAIKVRQEVIVDSDGSQIEDGYRRQWHENGQLIREIHFKNGEIYGWSRIWNEEGKLLGSASRFYDDETDGFETFYDENGQKRSETYYENGKRCGLSRRWHQDGRLTSKGNFRCKDGKKIGCALYWYDSGEKGAEYHFWDGKMVGRSTEWFKNGNREHRWYNNNPGMKNGQETFWYENGQKKSEGMNRAGKKYGWWSYWNERGDLIKRARYVTRFVGPVQTLEFDQP